jgi:D-cysteine desulfhydrase
MTFGCAGSNHALATAIYARQVGLKSISMLTPQPNTRYTRKNLLMSYAVDAELHHYQNHFALFMATYIHLLRHGLNKGSFPMKIPRGGTSPLGVIGFVNAAFELKEQISEERIPEPDYLYVALGSMGTAVGLLLGLKAADLKTNLVPVRIVPETIANKAKFMKLFRKTNDFLSALDPSFGFIQLSEGEIGIRNEYFGDAYALFTKKGNEARSVAKEKADLDLDGTYTGKTFAALIDDTQKRDLKEKFILFWLTLNSIDFLGNISAIDYHDLPRTIHTYFESEVQPLDRD